MGMESGRIKKVISIQDSGLMEKYKDMEFILQLMAKNIKATSLIS